MKILITNDDGIASEALKPLAEWAKTLGEVTVVAPKHQQSGKSHAINLHDPIEASRIDFLDGVEAFSSIPLPPIVCDLRCSLWARISTLSSRA